MGSCLACLDRKKKKAVNGVDNTPLLENDDLDETGGTPRLAVPLEPEETFAITLVGDAQSGKSALLTRFVDGTFVERYISTVGVEFKSKTLKVGAKSVKLQMWDTAGQVRFRTIAATYFRAARAVFLVFDITRLDSFIACKELLKDVRKNNAAPDLVLVLLANKCDEESARMVESTTANAFAEENGMKYFESSAKDGRNIDEAFAYATRRLVEQKLAQPPPPTSSKK